MTTPSPPLSDTCVRTQMAFLQTIDLTGKIYTDQTGCLPVTSIHGSKYLMVLYNHDSNAILVKPLQSQNEHELLHATTVLHQSLTSCGLKPTYQILDNECPASLKHFLSTS